MPNMLSNLQIHEISFVDKPANKGARVVLFQRDGSADGDVIAKAVEKAQTDLHSLDRAGYWSAIEALADRLAEPTDTASQAVDKALRTDVGGLLYEAYTLAKAAPSKVEKVATMRMPGAATINKLDALSSEIRKADPALTPEQAYTKALKENPELYSDYLEEKDGPPDAFLWQPLPSTHPVVVKIRAAATALREAWRRSHPGAPIQMTDGEAFLSALAEDPALRAEFNDARTAAIAA